MKILFLDDNKKRIEFFKQFNPDADIVENAQDCIKSLKENGIYDLICLDHDLGGEVYVNSENKNTGMEVVRYLESKEYRKYYSSNNVHCFIIVHTWNFKAGEEMVNRIRNVGYKVVYIPFSFNNTFVVN